MFMLLVVFFMLTIFRIDGEIHTNKIKSVIKIISNVSSHRDCLNHCLNIPNCNSVKWKNNICNLGITKYDIINSSNKNRKIFKLRVKRKDDARELPEAQISSTHNPKLSFYDRNVRYRNRFRLQTWKDWLIFVIAIIAVFIWQCIKDVKKPEVSSPLTPTPINGETTSASTLNDNTHINQPSLPPPSTLGYCENKKEIIEMH